MAKITGDVSVMGLANLLHVLAAHRREGALTVRAGEREKVFRLSAAGIRLVRGTSRENPVGRILMRTARVARQRVRGLMAAERMGRRSLGQMAVRQGLLTPDELDRALREQVAEEIYELFTWKGAEFEIADEADAPAGIEDGPLARVVLDADLTAILFEATRRADELGKIATLIPDRARIPQRLRNPSLSGYRAGDGDAVREIFALIDGRRTVAGMIDQSLFPEFTVLRVLYELAMAGVVRIRGRGEPTLGDSRTPSGTVERAAS